MTDKRELMINFSKTECFPEINYTLKIKLREAIALTLEHENFPYNAEVSVTFCSPEYIKKLNKQYRNINKPTDVLSFPMYEDGIFPPDECMMGAPIGDIVISIPRAKEQAEELSHGFVREMAFLTIHSTLHLLGYDHERSPQDDKRQCDVQNAIISQMEF